MLAFRASSVVEYLFYRKRGRPRTWEFDEEIEGHAVTGPGLDGFAKNQPARIGVVNPDFAARVGGCKNDLAGAKPAGYDDGRGHRTLDAEQVVRIGAGVSNGDMEIDVIRRECLLTEIESSVRVGSCRREYQEACAIPTPQYERARRAGIYSGGSVAMHAFECARRVETR